MDSKKYLAFWGWKVLPWNQTIDIESLYWQDQTHLTCSRLLLSLQRTASLFIVTAPPGHGKSTLGRWLYHRIDPQQHDVAFFSLLHTEHSSGWLLPKLGQYLGLEPQKGSTREILKCLQESRLHGKILTVVIDDAHKLETAEALDEILALSQVQSIAPNPINFVLLGNPRLKTLLQSAEGAQHRLGMLADLPGLNRQEILAYLTWRIESLSLPPKLLQADAQSLLLGLAPLSYASLEGLLEGALLEAFLCEQPTITVETLQNTLLNLGLQKVQEDPAQGSKLNKVALARRKPNPAPQPKPAGIQNQAMDLNSLYYKSGGGHDPDDS